MLNISEKAVGWSTITNDELQRLAQDIRHTTPNIGERRLMGALRSRGNYGNYKPVFWKFAVHCFVDG